MPQVGMFVVRLVGAVFVVVGGLLVLSPVLWSDSHGSSSGSVMAGAAMLAIAVVAVGFALTRSRR